MLNDTADWKNWAASAPERIWTAIGNQHNSFYGDFDGAGYIVGGVYINTTNNYQGLFGYVFDVRGSIRNLGVVASYVKGRNYVGGLVGVNGNNGSITNCYAAGNVSGSSRVGGLAGAAWEHSYIERCYATGNVTGNDYVGGLVGHSIDRQSTTNCYATGNVEGRDTVGGLVGANGQYATITHCYATGNVTGNSEVGGLVGINNYYNPEYVSISNSYYDSQTSGQSDEGKGTPKTTAQMKLKATYYYWDFNRIWEIDENINGGYPYHYIGVTKVTGIYRVMTYAKYNETKSLNDGTTVAPTDAYNKTIVWSVVNGGAEINGNDNITFTQTGYVKIRATIANGLGLGRDYTQDFTINVAKGDYDMSGITFENKTVTYDGNAHSIAIGGNLPSDVSVSYTGNEQTAVGAYSVTATFATANSNYNAPAKKTATLTIQESTPIRGVKKSGDRCGVRFKNSVVSDKLEILDVILPNDKVSQINAVIYDNTGNAVYSTTQNGKTAKWDLTNSSGRNVANGAYLVIVEARGVSGRVYWYSAKVGVKR